jgi:SAM-dependent methyltransferase
VVDLGSGSGMDSLFAARQVGESGRVIGIDITDAQLVKARRLAAEHGFANAEFVDAPVPRPLARLRGSLESLLDDPAYIDTPSHTPTSSRGGLTFGLLIAEKLVGSRRRRFLPVPPSGGFTESYLT